MRIVITGYNRPQYMKEVIASWSRVRGIQGVVVEFHLEPGNQEVLDACINAPFMHAIVVNGQVLGVQKNPWAALESGFQSDEFVIAGEDDIIVGTDTLEYFAWAEKEFRSRDDVLAISAARYEARKPEISSAVSVQPVFSSWVWGTWRKWWEKVGPDWDADARGWDYRLNYHWCRGLGLHTVQPHLSRAQHIGKFGGTHCTPEMFDSLSSRCFIEDVPPQPYFVVR